MLTSLAAALRTLLRRSYFESKEARRVNNKKAKEDQETDSSKNSRQDVKGTRAKLDMVVERCG